MSKRALSVVGAALSALALVLLGSGGASAATISVSVAAGATYNGKVALSGTAYPSVSATLQESWYSVRSSSSSLSCSYNGSSWSCSSTPTAVIKSVSATKTQSPSLPFSNSWSSSKCVSSSSTWYYYSFTAARVYMSGTSFSTTRATASAKYVCS